MNSDIKAAQLALMIAVSLTIAPVTMHAQQLKYSIQRIDRSFAYCGDFKLVITNFSNKPVLVKYFDGPPFKMTYVSEGKSYRLVHKLDQYATDNGASRAPNERVIGAGETFGFFVDLAGDFVVKSPSGGVHLFREFAVGKDGIIRIEPDQLDAFVPAETRKTIKTGGLKAFPM